MSPSIDEIDAQVASNQAILDDANATVDQKLAAVIAILKLKVLI